MLFKKSPIPRGYMLLEDIKPRPTKSWFSRMLSWFAAAAVLFILAFLFAESSVALEIDSLNDAESGQLVFSNSSGGYLQAVHIETTVDVSINSMGAKRTYHATTLLKRSCHPCC